MMKSLLYKEFTMIKKPLIFLVFYYILGGILAGLGGGMTAVCFGCTFTVSLLEGIVTQDEKSGWQKYSRALPHTAFQRVGAKYLFFFMTFFMMVLIVLPTGAITSLIFNEYQTFETVVNYWVPCYFSILVFYFSAFIIPSSLALIADRVIKGSIKHTLVCLLYLPSFFICYLLSATLFSGKSFKFNLFSSINKPQFAAMIVASALLLFAASYFISVIIETKSGRENLKAIKVIATVLTVVAVSLSGVTVYALDKDGAFEKKNTAGNIFVQNSNGEAVSAKDKAKDAATRNEMMKVAEHISGKSYTGIRTDDFYDEFEQAGFGECLVEFKDFYHSDKAVKISSVIYGTAAYTGGDSYTDGLQVKADISPNVVSALNADFKARELDALFPEGMSETDAIEAMKENELCPWMIREIIAEEKVCRTYSFSVEFSDEARSTMSMTFDIVDGAVCNKWNTRVPETE